VDAAGLAGALALFPERKKREGRKITLAFSQSAIGIRPYFRDDDQTRAVAPATMDDNDVVVVSLESDYLRFALEGATGTVEIGLNGAVQPMIVESDCYRHLIMPLSPNE